MAEFSFITVTEQGSVFESRTGLTEDEKLSWAFSGLNCERMSVGVRSCILMLKSTCLEQSYRAVLMFAVMVRRSILIRSKESERARKLICTGDSSGYQLAVNGLAC
jgi:hypothetical protein